MILSLFLSVGAGRTRPHTIGTVSQGLVYILTVTGRVTNPPLRRQENIFYPLTRFLAWVCWANRRFMVGLRFFTPYVGFSWRFDQPT